jgi:hypothetical protein
MTDRIISEIDGVGGYDGLLEALRTRKRELDVSFETLEHVSGLPHHYVDKVLGPCPMRSLGRKTLGALLGALALRLVVVADDQSASTDSAPPHRIAMAAGQEGHRATEVHGSRCGSGSARACSALSIPVRAGPARRGYANAPHHPGGSAAAGQPGGECQVESGTAPAA